MQKSLDSAGSRLQGIGSKLTAGITLPLVAAAAAATKFASDFETKTTRLVTLSGVSEASMVKMRQAVLDLAPSVGIGPGALADALLVVTSTGFEGAQALDILRIAAQSSAIGMGDAKEVARALTAVISAYGAENITAAQAGDILHATVVAGGAEAGELAGEIGRVVGVAAQLGVSFQEVGAFIATYTRLGLSAAEATTGLSGVLNTILSPSAEAKKALDGIGLSADMLRQMVSEKGLGAALGTLITKLDGNAEATGALFGNVRALAGVLGTAGVQAEGYKNILTQIQSSTGGLAAAFKVWEGTTASTWAKFMAGAEAAAIVIGNQLAPAFSSILTAAMPLVDLIVKLAGWFAQLPQPVQTATLGVLALAAALGPIAYVFGTVMTTGSALIGVLKLLPFSAMVTPIASAQSALTGFYAVALAHPFVAITAAIGAMVFALAKVKGAVDNAMSAFQQGGWKAVAGELGRNTTDDNKSFFKEWRVDQMPKTGSTRKTGDINLPLAGAAPVVAAAGVDAGKTRSEANIAAANAERAAWKKVNDEITGKAAIAAAKDWMKHLSDVGGVTHLTEKATKELNDTLSEALKAYALLGKTAPQAMINTWIATMETVKVTNGIQPGEFGQQLALPTVPEIPIPSLPKLTEGGLFGQEINLPQVPEIAKNTAGAFRTAFGQLGKELPGLIFGALRNGGGLDDVIAAVAGGIGSKFSSVFTEAVERAKKGGSPITGQERALGVAGVGIGAAFQGYELGLQAGGPGKGAAAGAASGAAMGTAIMPGWGTLVGAGVGAIAGYFGGKKAQKQAKEQMEQQKAEILKQYGGMDKLRELANSVGVSIDSAFTTKKPEEFRAVIEKLNAALEAQKVKFEGLNEIVSGVNERGKAFGASLEAGGVQPGSEAEFNRVGAMALGGLGASMATGTGLLESLMQLQPVLSVLNQAQAEFSFNGSEVTQRLLEMNAAVQANLPSFQALSADGAILNGMIKANWADFGLFSATTSDVTAKINELTAGGMSLNQALSLNQPVLQALWQAQQQFGFATDEATQALIDQAVANGVVGPQMKGTQDQMLDVLKAIAKVLGADIPAALAGLPGAAQNAANGMNVAFGSVKGPFVDMTGGNYTGANPNQANETGMTGELGEVLGRPAGTPWSETTYRVPSSETSAPPVLSAPTSGAGSWRGNTRTLGGDGTPVMMEMDGEVIGRLMLPLIADESNRLRLNG